MRSAAVAGTNPPPHTAPSPHKSGRPGSAATPAPGSGCGPTPQLATSSTPTPQAAADYRPPPGPGQRCDGLAPETAAAARRPGRDEPAPNATTTTPPLDRPGPLPPAPA